MRRRFAELMTKAGAISHRNFMIIASSSLIATAAVIGGAMTGGGFNVDAAIAAALNGQPAAAAVADPAASEGDVPDLSSATAGPAAPTPGPSAGPSGSTVTQDAPADTTTPTDPTTPTPPPVPPPTGPPGPFEHVFVVSLASPGYDAAFGEQSQMPYLSETLRPAGMLLSGYKLLDDKGVPNLIAMTSGQMPNADTKADCSTYSEFPTNAKKPGDDGFVNDDGFVDGDGCIYPVTATSVADQVGAAALSWHAYVEGMADDTGPANCVRPTPNDADETESDSNGAYAARQNPFIYFHSLLDLGSCSSNDVPIDGLTKDLSKEETTPNYTFISPDPCHSGEDGACGADGSSGAASADEYLSTLVPKILKSPAYKKDGLLIVTFDEMADSAAGDDGPVGTLVVSPFTTAGGTLADRYDPYSLLRSTEDILGLSPLASAAKASSFADDIVNGGD